MFFTHFTNNKKSYEITLVIKTFKPVSKKDKERLNKIALLIGSLGYKEDITEKEYRFNNDREEDDLLLDVEDHSTKK
jgi:hypothetical protein